MEIFPLQGSTGALVSLAPDEDFGSVGRDLIAAVNRHGFVYIPGYVRDPAHFKALTEQLPFTFARQHGIDAGYRSPVEGMDATVSTVTEGQETVEWHQELGYTPTPFDYICLHCVRPPVPSNEGQTLLAAGAQLFNLLDQRLQAAARRARIVFHAKLPMTEGYVKATLAVVGVERVSDIPAAVERANHAMPGGHRIELALDEREQQIRYRYTRPFVHRSRSGEPSLFWYMTLSSGAPDPESELVVDGPASDAPSLIAALDAAVEQTRYAHTWAAGDCVLVDNLSVMHKRTSFSDANRRILIRYARTVPAPPAAAGDSVSHGSSGGR
jgi:alpha-ketoglutarate-dependent taurine dioxygenase